MKLDEFQPKNEPKAKKRPTFVTIAGLLAKIEEIEPDHLSNFHRPDFNIFSFTKVVNRENVLKIMTVKALKDLNL